MEHGYLPSVIIINFASYHIHIFRLTVAYGVKFPITHYIGNRCVFHNILFYFDFINFLRISLIITPSPFAHFIIPIREKWREVIYSHYHMKNNRPESKP
jgi:hypothetical protein